MVSSLIIFPFRFDRVAVFFAAVLVVACDGGSV